MLKLNNKTLCESCFSELDPSDRSGVCPVCGFSAKRHGNEPGVLPRGTELHGRYRLGSVIGKGGFGITYIAYDVKIDSVVAVKEYFPGSLAYRAVGSPQVSPSNDKNEAGFNSGADKFFEEAKMVSQFNGNPCIVNVYDFFRENGTVYLVMEYIKGITLENYVKKFGALNSAQTAYVLDKVSMAMMNVHSNNFLHRDISPDNIMLCGDGKVKLIDFGAAREVAENAAPKLTVIIKQGYTPKEQYSRSGNHGAWSDIYSAGAVMYFALNGKAPDTSLDRSEPDCFDTLPKGADEGLWAIIKKAASVEIKDRYEDVFALKADLKKLTLKREAPVIPEDCGVISPLFTDITAELPSVRPAPKKRSKVPFVIGGAALAAAAGVFVVVLLTRGGYFPQVSSPDDPSAGSGVSQAEPHSPDESVSAQSDTGSDKTYTPSPATLTLDSSYPGDWWTSANIPRSRLAYHGYNIVLTLELETLEGDTPMIKPMYADDWNPITAICPGIMNEDGWVNIENDARSCSFLIPEEIISGMRLDGLAFQVYNVIVKSATATPVNDSEFSFYQSRIEFGEDTGSIGSAENWVSSEQLKRGSDIRIKLNVLPMESECAVTMVDDGWHPIFRGSDAVDSSGAVFLNNEESSGTISIFISGETADSINSDIVGFKTDGCIIRDIIIEDVYMSSEEKAAFAPAEKEDDHLSFGSLPYPGDYNVNCWVPADMFPGGRDVRVTVEYECLAGYDHHQILVQDRMWNCLTADNYDDGWTAVDPNETEIVFDITDDKLSGVEKRVGFAVYGIRVKSVTVRPVYIG